MRSAGLALAEHKTEAVLITSRKKVETIELRVGEHTIISQPYIRYLGVMLDARLTFKIHVEHVTEKATRVASMLSRLMPNTGGPQQARRKLLASVVTSVIAYAIPIWGDALKIEKYRRRVAAIYRLSALRVASAFRTVSEDAVCIIAGMIPIQTLGEERKHLYQQRGVPRELRESQRKQLRLRSLLQWQVDWDASVKGRWTHRLIPQVDNWMNRKHGEVNYYLTQMLSGHGCFRAYLYKYKHEESPVCPAGCGVPEDAEHVFFHCARFGPNREELKEALGEFPTPEDLVSHMLRSDEAWAAVSSFASSVLKELRREERRRKEETILVPT